MQIGMFTSGYQRNKIEDIFEDASRFGYDYIEHWGGRPHAYTNDLDEKNINYLKKLSEKYEIPIKVFTPEHNMYPYNYMIGSESQRKDSINYLKNSMDVGKKLGTEFMVISAGHAGYGINRKEIWNRFRNSIKELTYYAEKIDYKIVIESLTKYESNVCNYADDIMEILEQIDSKNLKGMCDVVVPFVNKEPVMNYFEKLGENLIHLHITDSDGISDTHLMPGVGNIPLEELIDSIKVFGYNNTVTLELVTAYINEPRLYSKRAINKFNELLK